MMLSNLPILYSFRRCPYAIRARLAIAYAAVQIEHREVILRDKPKELFEISAKATVPVLVVENGRVIDESLDIMHWALELHDSTSWTESNAPQHLSLIEENDSEFKHWLDRYKYANRHPDFSQSWYREQCEQFLVKLESKLSTANFLQGSHFGFTDAAIVPFVRQFSLVDKQWFAESHYPKIKRWLHQFTQSSLFLSIMDKYPKWQAGDNITYFPKNQH